MARDNAYWQAKFQIDRDLGGSGSDLFLMSMGLSELPSEISKVVRLETLDLELETGKINHVQTDG